MSFFSILMAKWFCLKSLQRLDIFLTINFVNFEEIKFIWCKAFKISNKWDYSITMIHTNLFSNIRISCAFLGPLTMLMLTCFHTILISVNHSNQIVPHRFQSTVSFWGSDQGLDKGRKRHICKIKQISNHRQLVTAK